MLDNLNPNKLCSDSLLSCELENLLLFSGKSPRVTLTIVSRSAERHPLSHPDDLAGLCGKRIWKEQSLGIYCRVGPLRRKTPSEINFSSKDVLNELWSAQC